MRNQISFLRHLGRSENIRQSLLMTGGTFTNSLLGLAFYILVARVLGPTNFGEFSLLIGLAILTSELTDFGLANGLVKFGAKPEFNTYFTIISLHRLILFPVLLVIAFLAQLALGKDFILASLITFSLLLASQVTYTFLSQKHYLPFTSLNILGNSVRLGLTVFVILVGIEAVASLLVVYLLGSLSTVLVGVVVLKLLLPRVHLSLLGIKSELRRYFSFSGWLGASLGLAAVATKIDLPVLYALGGSFAAGIYSSAQKLTVVFPGLLAALEGVYSPKFSDGAETKKNFRDYFAFATAIAVGLVIFIPLYPPTIVLFFGSGYAPSGPIFSLLAVGMAFFFLAGPFASLIVYRFTKPQIQLLMTAVYLILALTFYYFLVPPFGAYGAAITFVAVNFINLIIYIVVALFLKRSSKSC